jgi:biotin carboxylase
MNLLVTNTRNAQAYAIIRALRPHADKIVATMEGENRLAARLSHAANSRLVDKRYYTPSPAKDWRAGRIQKANTEREEVYIQAILCICEKESIDTIFPSFDPHVYVFSKNKERFQRIGVLIPVPDYEIVLIPLDKYRTIRAAQEVGFPCPKTYLPESDDDLRRIVDDVGFPLVIKPRFTAGGRGTEVVKDLPALLEKTRLIRRNHGPAMIQEYIAAKREARASFNLVVDKNGELKTAFSATVRRGSLRLVAATATVIEPCEPHPYVTHATSLLRHCRWWGGATVQSRIDSRDGRPKLMEINPRLGIGLWQRTELGINEPWMCLKIAKGEEVEAVKNYPLGVLLIQPVEDLMGLAFKLLDLLVYKIRLKVLNKSPVDATNPPIPLRRLLQSYKQTYYDGKNKIYNPYFKYFFQDPLVSLMWWCQFFGLVLRARRQLGR